MVTNAHINLLICLGHKVDEFRSYDLGQAISDLMISGNMVRVIEA